MVVGVNPRQFVAFVGIQKHLAARLHLQCSFRVTTGQQRQAANQYDADSHVFAPLF
jgi:hypothetical protein